jgi:hypothetical protein
MKTLSSSIVIALSFALSACDGVVEDDDLAEPETFATARLAVGDCASTSPSMSYLDYWCGANGHGCTYVDQGGGSWSASNAFVTLTCSDDGWCDCTDRP